MHAQVNNDAIGASFGVAALSGNMELALMGQAAAPPLLLIAAGVAWLRWRISMPSIAATLIALGVALITGMTVIVTGYSFPNLSALLDSLLLVAGLPLLAYVATVALFGWHTSVPKTALVVCAVVGLIPLYFLGGYVVINAACSFGTGGC